jgi:uncharacterized protein YndB with AHSA1/START domain
VTVRHDSWTATRTYPHTPAAVFAAWADPAVKVTWFDLSDGAPSEYTGDFRVGGAEALRVTDETGRQVTTTAATATSSRTSGS